LAAHGLFGATEKMLSCPRTGLSGKRTPILFAKALLSMAAAMTSLSADKMA